MTNLKSRIAIGAVFLGTAMLAGCSSNPPARPTQDPAQPTYSENREIAPLKVWIEPLGQNGNDTALRVMIEAREPMNYPIAMNIQLPPGAQLTAGNAQETLQLAQAGRTMRDIHVTTASPLTELAAVHVVLDGRSAATGIHSDVQFPRKAEQFVAPRNGPNPPGGRPPTMVPRSQPLSLPIPRIWGPPQSG